MMLFYLFLVDGKRMEISEELSKDVNYELFYMAIGGDFV